MRNQKATNRHTKKVGTDFNYITSSISKYGFTRKVFRHSDDSYRLRDWEIYHYDNDIMAIGSPRFCGNLLN